MRRRRIAQMLRVTSAPSPPPARTACWAPHRSIYFDQFGSARACCQNSEAPLGNIATQTIREIWSSAEAAALRDAVDHHRFDLGCEFCGWQLREGNDSILFARQYDYLEPGSPDPTSAMPTSMEFALTNACNLQCAMCDGEFSSAIRVHREGRAPLPPAYGESFFEELAEFLPYLTDAKFAGGEPFIGAEPLRVMEMLAALDHPPSVSIITNGTILTPRVERILAALAPQVIVSIDGASTETYDAIRVGAHLPKVLAHLDRFVELLGPNRVSITHCLMTSNWHEFGDLLLLAQDRSLEVGVNVVRFPEHLSLYRLPPAELDAVVAAMRAEAPPLRSPWAEVWDGQVSALDHRIEAQRSGNDPGVPSSGDPGDPGNGPPEVLDDAATSRWPWLPYSEEPGRTAGNDPGPTHGPASVVSLDLDGTIEVVRSDAGSPFPVASLAGSHVADLYTRLVDRYGALGEWELDERRRPRDDDRFWVWPNDPAGDDPIEVVGTSIRDESGALIGGLLTIRRSTLRPGEPWPGDPSDSG